MKNLAHPNPVGFFVFSDKYLLTRLENAVEWSTEREESLSNH